MLVQATRFIDFILSLAGAETMSPAECVQLGAFLAMGFPAGLGWPAMAKVLNQRQIDMSLFAERYRAIKSLYDFLTSPNGGGKGSPKGQDEQRGARRKGKGLPSKTEGALPRNPLDFAPDRA
jgi:hypothetical protein